MENTTKDWKDDIGTFLKENKVFRMELLIRQLNVVIKEWTEFLKNFDNIRTGTDINLLDNEFNGYNSTTITVKIRSKVVDYPAFLIMIGYMTNDDHTETILKVKYSNNINYGNFIKNNSREEDKLNHYFVQENFSGEQIFKDDFILNLLNDLLKKWVNKNNLCN